MSLILEALKKSEARRRLGEAPDIGTPFTPVSRRRSAWPFIVIALAVVAGAGWWYVRSSTAVAPATMVATAPGPTPVNAQRPAALTTPSSNLAASPNAAAARAGAGNGLLAAQRASPIPLSTQAATAQSPRPAPTPATSSAAPLISPAQRPVAAISTAAPLGPAMNSTTAKPSTGVQPAPRSATAKFPAAPMTAPSSANVAAQPAAKVGAQSPPLDSPPSATPTIPVTTQPTASAPASAATPAAETLPQYYELPLSLRRDLPPIAFSMHVYAADPKQRFVVVDGERKGEGDTLKDDVMLHEIRADGLVLEFRGQRFFYPRNGH